MAQITNVTSELLQAKIRQLLPSQQGFGEDLQAQNVIVPIIDLTETAEGSAIRQDLQTALNLGGATTFNVDNATTSVLTGTGFFRFTFTVTQESDSGINRHFELTITDGVTSKVVLGSTMASSSTNAYTQIYIDEVIFLTAGESVSILARPNTHVVGSYRQIADINGNLVNPVGFSPQ